MDFKMPPNYRHHCHRTLEKKLSYGSFPVSSSSDEYAVIRSLVDSVHITSVEQVVNPTLWDKFQQKRKEMLRCKSTDAKALSAIGLSDMEVREVLAYAKNYTPHVDVAHVPFDHNMALLYHCTSSKENIENILTEGLDERLGNRGYLGQGIYFAYDPEKSMAYDRCGGVIFIFGVLLGDCMSMAKSEKNGNLVREPKKADEQKRHLNDLFFDSIVGKPDGTHNEFVVYNRYQCIPLYKVNYEKAITSNGNGQHIQKFDSADYVQARKEYPEICWKKSDEHKQPMPSITRMQGNIWPFSSNEIFGKMGV